MRTEWHEVLLEDVAEDITVGFVGTMMSEYLDEGIPFLRSKNVEPFRVNFDDMKYIGADFHHKIIKSKLVPGDVIIVRTGKPGACSVVPSWLGEANCSDLVIVRCSSKINNNFLAYYINSAAAGHINAHLVGAVQQHFNVGSARTLCIKLPSIEEQKAIAHVLGSLDDKIELNQRMNETLESIAQAQFKSWFVDFDPVIDNALKSGNEIPEELQERAERRQSLGPARKPPPEDIRKLFPSEFELTEELGWIPKGWKVATIHEEVETVGGGTPSTQDPTYWENGIHAFCTPKDMSKMTSMILTGTDRQLTDEGVTKISSGRLSPGTVLLSSRAPIGYLAVSDIPVSVNQGIIAMKPNERYGSLFLLCWTQANMEAVLERANGSTFLEISKRNFRSIPFLVPHIAIVSYFNKKMSSICARLSLCSKNTNEIKSLRDTLLPKLISGQIRVPEAERLVEEAA
jgi:type I restriction enzyme S subunit